MMSSRTKCSQGNTWKAFAGSNLMNHYTLHSKKKTSRTKAFLNGPSLMSYEITGLFLLIMAKPIFPLLLIGGGLTFFRCDVLIFFAKKNPGLTPGFHWTYLNFKFIRVYRGFSWGLGSTEI